MLRLRRKRKLVQILCGVLKARTDTVLARSAGSLHVHGVLMLFWCGCLERLALLGICRFSGGHARIRQFLFTYEFLFTYAFGVQ